MIKSNSQNVGSYPGFVARYTIMSPRYTKEVAIALLVLYF